MRILLIAVVIFTIIHFVRTDLMEGTISFASFIDDNKQCEEKQETLSIPIMTVEGDTIEALFALYPDKDTGLIERLTAFYSLNPHLQKQKIVGGEKILLPLSLLQVETCKEFGR